MQVFKQKQRFIAFIACVAVLLNALAPAISHTIAAAQDKSVSWIEVCSASGTKLLPFPADQLTDKRKGNDSKPMSMDHCAYCLSHVGSFGLLGDSNFTPAPVNLSYSLPKLFYHSPRPLFVWAASNPRAPPVLS